METFEFFLTDAQKQKLIDLATAKGLNPMAGILPKENGVTLGYELDDDKVQFTVISKPAFMPMLVIKNKVKDLLNKV